MADASITFDTKIDNSKFKQSLSNMGSSVKSAFGTMTKIIAGVSTALVGVGGVLVKTGVEFESAFAGVKKTVNATEEEFAILEQGIRDMAKVLPSSASAIAEVVEVAGQLGIEKENVLAFSKVMIDMGESTDLSATTAAESIAKFANITGMAIADASRMGSTIVALGNNFATTESSIMNLTMYMAGMGAQVGMSTPQILAWSTAMSSVDITRRKRWWCIF